MLPNDYAYAAGASTGRSDQHHPFHPRGGGAAAWAKTEASASFWTIGDVTAPGIYSTPEVPTHPAPVDVGVVLGGIFLYGRIKIAQLAVW